jgi:hypothetical protein
MTADWGDAATWVAALGGLATGSAALFIAWGTKQAAKQQSVEMAEANKIARQALKATQEANQPSVGWSVSHHKGAYFGITNTGDAPAHDVTVRHQNLKCTDMTVAAGDLSPGEGCEFIIIGRSGTTDNNLYVTWRDTPSGLTRTWRHPLPPRDN